MKRKDFNSLVLTGGVLGLTSCAIPNGMKGIKNGKKLLTIKPKRLKRGDTIGLIAPGSAFSEDAYKRTLDNIKSLGLKYKNAKNLFGKYGYVAGKDQDRIDDIHEMFSDKSVDAIWCVRGGYGTTRIMYDLDYDLIKKNPKIIIGYSDITALLQAINKKTGLITFHGPVGSSRLTDYTLYNFKKIFFEANKKTTIQIYKPIESEVVEDSYLPSIITKGNMNGELIGGNLSLLVSMAGTDFDLEVKDKIVFIEDVGEKPYRIDRMLTQLVQTSKLKEASGILLGVFNDCDVEEGKKGTLRLNETIKDRLGDLDIPVFYGYSFGHIENMCTLPVGIKALFDMDKKELILLENVVI